MTQNAPDIHMPGAFCLAECTYGVAPYRSAPLCLFDKLEVAVVKVMLILRYYSSELRHSFFSLCVSIQNIERAK